MTPRSLLVFVPQWALRRARRSTKATRSVAPHPQVEAGIELTAQEAEAIAALFAPDLARGWIPRHADIAYALAVVRRPDCPTG